MIYLWVSLGLLLHILLWGAGLALLVTPARWRKFWPVWAAPGGVLLQSAVVWCGAHTTLPGTDAYAGWAECLPLGLLAWGGGRRGWRQCGRDLRSFAGLGAVMAAALAVLTLPLASAARFLTSVSLGSCDAADYAAGARVLQEFASNDRSGFLGLTEVVRVGSVDNFFDFWLRLNHFTPSALIALNDSIFGLAPHQTTGLMTVVLTVLVLPMVFWLARSTAGLGSWTSGWVAFIYAASPITGYAVYNVAPAQIIAAQAIALLTWAGVALWREPSDRRRWTYGGLLGVAFGLIWGAYNFIVIVCLVPALGAVGGWALAARKWTRLVRWLGWLLLPLGVSALFFHARAAGLVERFQLFQQYDFGWKIPVLWPEGWLGLISGVGSRPLAEFTGYWSGFLAAVTLILIVASIGLTAQRRPRHAWLMVAFLVPVLGGYAYLEWRGHRLGNNASYDAFKLFSVFYPVLLIGFCHWLTWLARRSLVLRTLAVAMALLVTGLNLRAGYLMTQRVEDAQLIVDRDLLALGAVEEMEQVKSVNLLVPDFWMRLWANELMLRKPQYFRSHTYEGRLDTPLRGEWDCNGGTLQVRVPGGDGIALGRRYSLVRTGSPFWMRASLGEGWHGTEMLLGRQTTLWNWTKGDATLELENLTQEPLRVVLHLTARSVVPRDLQIWLGDTRVRTMHIGKELRPVRVPAMLIPPGKVTVALRSSQPPVRASEHDERLLGFAAYSIIVDVRSHAEALEPGP